MVKLFQPLNSKLGPIPNIALPSGLTCPGASEFCERYCYGRQNWYREDWLKARLQRVYEVTGSEDFERQAINELKGASVVRVHTTGDFYSADYIAKWFVIATALPATVFYTYTRSWRVPELNKALHNLADNCRNFVIRASTDFTHTERPDWPTFRVGPPGKDKQCPHDRGTVENCWNCGICWKHPKLNIWTSLRWGKRWTQMSPRLL